MAAAVTAFALLTVTVIPFFSPSGSYTYFNTTHAGSTGTSLPSSLIDAAVANLHSVSGLALLGALAVTAAFGLRSPLILVMVPTLLIVRGLGLVGRHPRNLLADVDHLHEVRIDSRFGQNLHEGVLVLPRRAGGDHNPVGPVGEQMFLEEGFAFG